MSSLINSQQDIHTLTGSITAELDSGLLTLADIGEKLKQLSDAQHWLLGQIEQISMSTPATTVKSLAWDEILTQLEAPPELAKDLEQIGKAFSAREAVVGYSPVEAWEQCYSYFEQLKAHLEGLSKIAQSIQDDPNFLPKALETLKLRAVSKDIHQSF